jgi:hypothetical protein
VQGVHNRVLELCSQCKECVYELFQVREECEKREHQNSSHIQRGASRLLNTLEGKVCVGESTARVVEYSESSTRWALSWCKCAQDKFISNSRREVSEEDTPRVTDYSGKETR